MFRRSHNSLMIRIAVPLTIVFSSAVNIAYCGNHSIQSSDDSFNHLYIWLFFVLSMAVFFLVVRFCNKPFWTPNTKASHEQNGLQDINRKSTQRSSKKCYKGDR